MTVDDGVEWANAEAVCTEAELQALRLHEEMDYKRMARVLELSASTVRGRVDRAEAKVRREVNAGRALT